MGTPRQVEDCYTIDQHLCCFIRNSFFLKTRSHSSSSVRQGKGEHVHWSLCIRLLALLCKKEDK